ncbi:MAG: hypothetical protein K2P81_10765 [Bacteriovoracaceae bacterium]|nr:hypothetical protein [Bacteriovoracaceae bacterium]
MKRYFLFALVFALSSNVWAKRFSNQYCEFELPSGWQCALEGSEYVCQSENESSKKEAIIILAAKRRGEQDSMEEYTAYLKKPKTYSLPGGKVQVSEAKYTKLSDVNSHQWIDSLHLASEVPGFYTRYLATVKEDLGVAVTFSVAKDLYQQYQGIFDGVVASLRVFRQKSDTGTNLNLAANDANLADTTFVPDGDKVDISVQKTQERKTDDGGGDMMLYAGIGIAALVLFILKKKGGKKG